MINLPARGRFALARFDSWPRPCYTVPDGFGDTIRRVVRRGLELGSMGDDTYNGWTNRETWAAALWLSNDQGLYSGVKDALEHSDGHPADTVREYVTELLEEYADELRSMRDDIGSLWRVDWGAVADSFTES